MFVVITNGVVSYAGPSQPDAIATLGSQPGSAMHSVQNYADIEKLLKVKDNCVPEGGFGFAEGWQKQAEPKPINFFDDAVSMLEFSAAVSDTFKEVVSKLSERTFGFILINHANWESEELAQHLLDFVEEDAIVIFVGINKNAETKLVWNHLISNLNKSISVNLFNFGIIFLKKEVLKKQQFTIRF